MTGERYRIVTHTGGEEHVSSVVLAAHEVAGHLDVELVMHRAAGWEARLEDGIVYCQRGDTYRTVRAERFSPQSDTPSSAGASRAPRREPYDPRLDHPERYGGNDPWRPI